MKVVAAYLLALLGGNTSPSAEDLKKILGSGISFYLLTQCESVILYLYLYAGNLLSAFQLELIAMKTKLNCSCLRLRVKISPN